MSDTSARANLLIIKLRAIAADHGADAATMQQGEFGLGAAAMAGDVAWVLLDRDARIGIGPAVIWALRRNASQLHVLAEDATGLLARRATAFRLPIRVWLVDGRALIEALPDTILPPASLPDGHREFESLILQAGASPVVEHGVLIGEVEGLEVCRVVADAETGEPRLEVGIGAHDRETFQLLHGDRPKVEALADVVRTVAVHRRPGAAIHPLNRLAAPRGVRSVLIREPQMIGANSIAPIEPPFARPNVKDVLPCVAVATIGDVPTLLVCSSGVDLDIVPFASDARRSSGITPCIVALPARDLLPAQQLLADNLIDPVRFVTVDPPPATEPPPSP